MIFLLKVISPPSGLSAITVESFPIKYGFSSGILPKKKY